MVGLYRIEQDDNLQTNLGNKTISQILTMRTNLCTPSIQQASLVLQVVPTGQPVSLHPEKCHVSNITAIPCRQ